MTNSDNLNNRQYEMSIIAQAHILADFLPEFIYQLNNNPNRTIETFYRNYETRIGIEHREGQNIIWTPGAVLGICYLLILFPRETFLDRIPEIRIINSRNNNWCDFTIYNFANNGDLRYLTRNMRNSLAHGYTRIDNEFNFHFKNYNRDNQIIFHISFSLEEMKIFIIRFNKIILRI